MKLYRIAGIVLSAGGPIRNPRDTRICHIPFWLEDGEFLQASTGETLGKTKLNEILRRLMSNGWATVSKPFSANSNPAAAATGF